MVQDCIRGANEAKRPGSPPCWRILNTSWVAGCFAPIFLANPLTGLTPLGPLKSIQISPQKTVKINLNLNTLFPVFQKLRKRCRKRCRKRIPPSVLGHFWKSWIFEIFQNYTSPGGVNPKNILRLPTGPMGWSMPNLGKIHPVVWAPNPNKQTGRHASLIYIYI